MRKIFIFFLFSLLLFDIAYAEVPWVKFSYFQNWGGLNDQLSSTEIQDNEATEIQNIVFDTGGALKKRFGFTTVPSTIIQKVATGTTVAVNGIAFYKKNNGNRYAVVIANNDSKATAMKKDYQAGGGLTDGAWENIDNPNLPSAFADSYKVDFAVAEDNIVITMESSTGSQPFLWTGTGRVARLTYDADCPNASIGEYHRNHLFLSGNSTNPSRTYFSALDNITNYTATDFFDVQTSDGTQVRGLLSIYNALYIFKDKSIWRLSGEERDSFILEKMVEGVGTLSNNSIQVVNNLIYFTTSQNDIAVYDGGYNVQFLSQKIRNTISNLNFSRATNTLGLAFSSYRYQDKDYYCAVSSSGVSQNDTILLFDTAYKAWLKFSGITPNAWCIAEDSNAKNIMLFGDYSGYVHQYPSSNYYDGNVATNPISTIYQTKWFRYPELKLGDKYWRLIKVYSLTESNTTTLYVECKVDQEASGKTFTLDLAGSASLWDVARWDVDTWGGQSILINRKAVERGKNMFQIRLTQSELNRGFTLLGFENFIEPTDQI